MALGRMVQVIQQTLTSNLKTKDLQIFHGDGSIANTALLGMLGKLYSAFLREGVV